MKIVVTGGAGYIGFSLAKALVSMEAVDRVFVYDNLSRGHYGFFFQGLGKKIKFIEGELLDSRTLSKVLDGAEGVFHLAAKVSAPHSNLDSHFFEQTNHWGTAELVNLVEKSDVRFFTYLSSGAVYGHSTEPLDEDSALMPVSFYGHSKMRGENHVWRLFEQIPFAYAIRSANVYGYNPTLRMDTVINRFVFEANFQNKIIINGTGEQKRAFVQVDKLAAFLANLTVIKPKSGIYNCAQYNFSLNQIAEYLKSLYPHLETMHLNQHITLPSAEFKLPVSLPTEGIWNKKSFEQELLEMKNRFEF